MKKSFPFLLSLVLLSGCAPHPGAGVWKAEGENAMGISTLTLSYDGRARFDTSHPKASWHCFWSGTSAERVELSCTPSTEPDQTHHFQLQVANQERAELIRGERPVALLRRLSKNPVID